MTTSVLLTSRWRTSCPSSDLALIATERLFLRLAPFSLPPPALPRARGEDVPRELVAVVGDARSVYADHVCAEISEDHCSGAGVSGERAEAGRGDARPAYGPGARPPNLRTLMPERGSRLERAEVSIGRAEKGEREQRGGGWGSDRSDRRTEPHFRVRSTGTARVATGQGSVQTVPRPISVA